MLIGVSYKWVVLWSLWAARAVRQPTAARRVRGGALRGSAAHDGSHAHYLAIPYATLGPEHRFKAPGPEPTWDGTFEAINEHTRCPQKIIKGKLIGQEDCLTLNVYTPLTVDPSSRLAVMVFIHGGGYYQGSSSRFLYDPRFLVDKGVILVTLNYRLNIQGFLCLRTKDAPGNAGMKDQVAALRWVQRNIRAFGGDPDNVTIFGESAGGASVSYHVLSPMSKGLFHKAILQSGSSLGPWAYQPQPIYAASLLAKTMGYNTEDPDELYRILMSKSDYELIITRVQRPEGNIYLSELLYVPCTEAVIEGVEPFLTGTPYELLSKGEYNKVPMIIGTNNEEGYYFANLENSTTLPKIRFEKSLPKGLGITSEEERKVVADKLKKIYLGDEEMSRENMAKWSRYYGEPFFNFPSLSETEVILNTTDKAVFNYFFEHSGWRNFAKLSLGRPLAMAPGATHADELFYLFKSFKVPKLFENRMIETMTTLWTNFAKLGNPTPAGNALGLHWPRTAARSPRALLLGAGPARTQPLWHSASLRYWRELYRKYGRKQD